MRSVCLINSYNYETYLEECVRSALRQTHPFDVIHIVDDGSTDKSRPLLEALASQFHNIVLHFKQNGGQLSCFNTATQFVQPDDLICMLDADDVLPADYLALLLQKRQLMPADLYFCEPTYFKNTESPPASAARATSDLDFNWQISSHTARTHRTWTGSPTSCISLTGALFLQLLPFPLEGDWRTRADDILIYGSAIAGVSKCVRTPALRRSQCHCTSATTFMAATSTSMRSDADSVARPHPSLKAPPPWASHADGL